VDDDSERNVVEFSFLRNRAAVTLFGLAKCCWWMLGVLVLLTVLAFFARTFWAADLVANLRVQLVIALLVAGMGSLLLRRWRFFVTVLVILSLHLPWFHNAFPEPSSDLRLTHVMTVTSVNVLSANREYAQVIDSLHEVDPDVIAVLELTPVWDQQLRRGLSAYQHVVVSPEDQSNFGIGVYSKYPLKDVQFFHAVEGVPSIALTVGNQDAEEAGKELRLFVTHPLPPMNRVLFEDRNRQLRDVGQRIREYRQQVPGLPVVLLGDLNLTPWSPCFDDLQANSGLKRGIDRFTLEPTWYRFRGFPFGLVIDHGLIDPRLVCTRFQVGRAIGSDHRSITLDLALGQ